MKLFAKNEFLLRSFKCFSANIYLIIIHKCCKYSGHFLPMNFLIIINHTEYNHFFFSGLGESLEKRGHKVCYALESRINNFHFSSKKITKNVYFFTDYISESMDTSNSVNDYADINLWELFFSDFDRFENFRINLGKDSKWYESIASSRIQYYEKIYSKEKIDAVIFEPISSSINYFAYVVAQKKGIRYLGLAPSRIPNRYEIHTGYSTIKHKVKNIFDKITSNAIDIAPSDLKKATDYLDSFDKVTPDYMTFYNQNPVSPVKKYFHMKNFKNIFNSIRYILSNCENNFPYEVGNPLIYSWRMYERTTKRFFKSRFISKYYSNITNKYEKFLLYPLHYHPESSTSVIARHYVDEYTVIKNIAFNLPFGFYLYVKDHPAAAGLPSINFYNKIRKIPNVKIIGPGVNTKNLIKKSSGVITLTSTVGFEAIILDKPVIVLGDVFYNFHPKCVTINNWDDIFPALNRLVNSKIDANKKETLDFIMSYFLSTYEGTLIMDRRYKDFDSLIDNILILFA